MQDSKKKLLLEHVVVEKMRTHTDVKQQELDNLLRYGAEGLFAEEPAPPTAQGEEGGASGAVGTGSGVGVVQNNNNNNIINKGGRGMTVEERERQEGRTGGDGTWCG